MYRVSKQTYKKQTKLLALKFIKYLLPVLVHTRILPNVYPEVQNRRGEKKKEGKGWSYVLGNVSDLHESRLLTGVAKKL